MDGFKGCFDADISNSYSNIKSCDPFNITTDNC